MPKGGREKESILIAASDEVTALTAGVAKTTFRMPYAFRVTEVRGSLTASQASGQLLTVDVNEGANSILTAKLTIDNGERTSTTAAAPAVIWEHAAGRRCGDQHRHRPGGRRDGQGTEDHADRPSPVMAVQPHRFGTATAYVPGKPITSLANATISPGPAGGFEVREIGGPRRKLGRRGNRAAHKRQQQGEDQVRQRRISRWAERQSRRRDWPCDGRQWRLPRLGDRRSRLFARPFQQPDGANQGAASGFAWVEYNASDDKVRFYKSASSDFGSAVLIRTEGPVGAGLSWGFEFRPAARDVVRGAVRRGMM